MTEHADLQLMSNLSVRSVTVPLNQSINSFNTVHCSSSDWTAVFIKDACSAVLEPFHPVVHIPLRNAVQ